MKFDFDNERPIYIQLVEQLRIGILTSKFGVGEKIPSVRDLAEEIKVNPNTIVRAYQELEREGVTETRRGMGTFIVDSDKNSILQMKNSIGKTFVQEFIKKMHEVGVTDAEIINLVKESIGEK